MGEIIEDKLTEEECDVLLLYARRALEAGVKGETLEPVDLVSVSSKLRENGASFVTLTMFGQLRGCIGTLEPYQPLIGDVCEHAIAAATQDYRFPKVKTNELGKISIEISRLTKPKPLAYKGPDDLLSKLRPGIDGVVIKDGLQRATFLPQVWNKIPNPSDFLDHLCRKMGAPSNTWRLNKLDVLTYQVQEIHE